MTAELIPPGDLDFAGRFHSFRESVFRLETLQHYGNSGEEHALAAFASGVRNAPRDRTDAEWEDMIRTHVRAGRLVERVHVVVEPLTDYMKYELTWAYASHVLAGEDVRIIPVSALSWPEQLPAPGTDFWLFDSVDLFRQHYDESGWWLGTELVRDEAQVGQARGWRDAALRLAEPWEQFMTRHPELAEYLPQGMRKG